jgi:L-fucose isomerase-like protein
MEKLRLGFVGTSFANFSAKEYGVYQHAVEGLESLAEAWGFNLLPLPDAVQSAEDAEKAARRLADEEVDFVLIQASSFALGDVWMPLLKIEAPLGIWSVPEPSLSGEIPLNSFSGLNLATSLLRKNLPDRQQPFKWFYGDADDEFFQRRLCLTVRALTALKNLRATRILLLGDVAPTFYNLAYDPTAIETRLGLQVERHALDDIFERAQGYTEREVSRLVEAMTASAARVAVDRSWLELTGRAVLAIRDAAADGDCDAVALRCWPEFQEEMGGLGPCAAVAWLNDHGLPTSCEGDVVGAISMLALHHLSEAPTTMMDLVTVIDEEDLIHLWHCGPTAGGLADEAGQCITYHPTLDRSNPPGAPRSGASSDVVLRPGPLTVARFSPDASQAFLLTGQVVEGPSRGYQGSRGWVTDLRIDGEPARARDLIETASYQGLPHHYPLALGDWADAFRELVAWADIDIMKLVPYRDFSTSASSIPEGGGSPIK